MIILFSSSLGLTAVSVKRRQLEYIETLVYLANRVLLLLKSTMPETQEILRILKSDKALFEFDFETCSSPYLSESDNKKTADFINSIGKYDIDSQISITQEYIDYFKLLKSKYQEYFDNHYKLYIALGITSGLAVTVLLI